MCLSVCYQSAKTSITARVDPGGGGQEVQTPLPPGKSQVNVHEYLLRNTRTDPLEKQLDPSREVLWPLVTYVDCITGSEVLWCFLAVLWVALQCVIVALSDHTHLFFKESTFIYC